MNKALSPHGQNIVVFDCEIKEEIKGLITWNDHDKMGISVAVAYHYLTEEFHVFMDDNIEELPYLLNQAEIVSGFNIIGFDNKLVNASCSNKYTNEKNSYDLLVESRKASGWRQGMRFPSGMKLDDHLLGTFGKDFMKTAHGSEAPGMWQNKQLGKLISYCIDDVKRECKLFEHVYAGFPVTTPLHGSRILKQPTFMGGINDNVNVPRTNDLVSQYASEHQK